MSRKPILTLLALVCVCLSALAFSAQSVKNHNLTFNAFHPSQDGKIRYSVIVEVNHLYDKSRSQRTNRFSDYFAKRLATNLTNPPALDNDYWPGATIHPGTQILVFGPEAAYAAETGWVLSSMEARSVHGVNGNNIQGAPLDYIIGTHSLTGDPDDPEPPFMIVTRAPRLKGLNVDN